MPSQAPDSRVMLTPEQLKRQRSRNLALALALGFLVILFFVITIVKMAPQLPGHGA